MALHSWSESFRSIVTMKSMPHCCQRVPMGSMVKRMGLKQTLTRSSVVPWTVKTVFMVLKKGEALASLKLLYRLAAPFPGPATKVHKALGC